MRNNIYLFDLIELISPLKKFVESHNIDREIIDQVEIEVKYSGYIEREKAIADKLKRLEDVKIPADFDFMKITSITIEARQKLSKIRPTTVGQASRIPGVSPADINVLLIFFGR
jgi:tRNA uridine 5-carboxymethylaminomethyl modification enzyme